MRRVLIPWGAGRAFAQSGSGLLIGGKGCITAFSARNTGAANPAELVLYDGQSANGRVLLDWGATLEVGVPVPWVPHALPFEEGLYIVTVAGAAVGTITAWADHHCAWWLEAEHKAAELVGAEALAQLTGS